MATNAIEVEPLGRSIDFYPCAVRDAASEHGRQCRFGTSRFRSESPVGSPNIVTNVFSNGADYALGFISDSLN